MSNVMEEIKLSIAKNMPGMVGDELKRLLADGEASKEALVHTRTQLAAANDKVAALQAKLSQHADLDIRQKALDEQQQKLQDTELSLLKREAQISANITVAELSGVKYAMTAFLQNQTIRTKVQESVHVPLDGHPGGNGMYATAGMAMKVDNQKTTTEEQA